MWKNGAEERKWRVGKAFWLMFEELMRRILRWTERISSVWQLFGFKFDFHCLNNPRMNRGFNNFFDGSNYSTRNCNFPSVSLTLRSLLTSRRQTVKLTSFANNFFLFLISLQVRFRRSNKVFIRLCCDVLKATTTISFLFDEEMIESAINVGELPTPGWRTDGFFCLAGAGASLPSRGQGHNLFSISFDGFCMMLCDHNVKMVIEAGC
jgi:hypothetical protein